MSLPPEQEASYSAIIDDILANSDLNTITGKAIQRGLQEKVHYDITSQKAEIKKLIRARFDKYNLEHGAGPEDAVVTKPPPTKTGTVAITNGIRSVDTDSAAAASASAPSSPKKRREPDAELGPSYPDGPSPPKKKTKKTSVEEDDAAFAARLQAEENNRVMARSTRGGATKKRTPMKNTKKKETGKKKKKSANKVNSDDDSDLDSGNSPKKEVKRTGGFHKPMILSPPLAALVGETQLSRPLTVKKVWEYIKERDLQDPLDKRHIRCDDAMRAVFKQDRVHMFTMTKLLNQNLYSPDE